MYRVENPEWTRRSLPHWQFLWRLWHAWFQWHLLSSHSLSAWPHPSLSGRVSVQGKHRFAYENWKSVDRLKVVILWIIKHTAHDGSLRINSHFWVLSIIAYVFYGSQGTCDYNFKAKHLFFSFIFISWRLITLQYCSGFCHTLTWISHGYTCIPHPDPPSHLPLHLLPLGLPSAPGLNTCLMHPTWAGDLFHPR